MSVDIEMLKSKVLQDIQQAEDYFQSQIQPKVLERYQLYKADPEYYAKLFPKLADMKAIVATDVADTVEWIMPSLMRVFFGSTDVITVQGRTPDDDKQAEIMQALVNYQIQRQNQGFMIFYRWFKDALITGLGIVKAYWVRDWNEKVVKKVIGYDELELLQNASDVEIVSYEDLGNGLVNATIKLKQITRNQPVIENIPASEFLFNPNAKTIKDSPFVAHKKVVSADYLLRKAKEGMYDEQAVREVIEYGEGVERTELDYYLNPSSDTFNEAIDKARKQFTLYECYTKYDINNDGLLEDVIITICSGKILRVVENIYGRPPFFVLSPILEPYQIWGKAYADIIKDIQNLKTALIRQIVMNIALINDPKFFIDESKVNVNDYLAGKPFIRVQGIPQQAIQPWPVSPLAPWTFNFLEYWEGLKENRTGITRYNQGLDARSLNKTATGIQLIMQASNQRLELIARIFAETGVKELFEFLVELNLRFIDQKTVIRLFNQPLVIRPDDLQGKFDLIVNTTAEASNKQQVLQGLQMLIQLYPQLIQFNIATPKNMYNALKKIVETMGFKNVNDFLTDPSKLEAINAGQETGALGGIQPNGQASTTGGGLQVPTGEGQAEDISRMEGE